MVIFPCRFARNSRKLVKSGCISREVEKQGSSSRQVGIFRKSHVHKSGIRKSKTSRWRASALILLNLLMIAHIIQWRIMGKTVSPIEPSETMHTLQQRGNQRGVHLLFPGDPGDVNLRTVCLRLGLSHSRPPRFLRLDAKKNWPHSEAVSIQAAGLCPAHRRPLHVCLAYRLSLLHKARARTSFPEIHQSSGHD